MQEQAGGGSNGARENVGGAGRRQEERSPKRYEGWHMLIYLQMKTTSIKHCVCVLVGQVTRTCGMF